MSTRPLQAAATVAILALVGAGCGDQARGAADNRTLTVLAAASLTEAFTELGRIYEREHAGVTVRFSFDSSSTLASQAVAGAPADVLATADEPTMRTAEDAGVVKGERRLFASNTMVLVVPAGNPAGIDRFAELEQPEAAYVACEPSVPCGSLARRLLAANDVDTQPRSFEVDVKAVLTKVELDEADAGLVYESDAVAAGHSVQTIEIPGAERAVNRYPIGVLEQSEHPGLARAWVDLVTSPRGQRVLDDAGFGPP